MSADKTDTDSASADAERPGLNGLFGLLILVQVAALASLATAFGASGQPPPVPVAVAGVLSTLAFALALLVYLVVARLRLLHAAARAAEQAAVASLLDALNQFGSGDLTVVATGTTTATATLAAAVNRVAEQFRSVVGRFADTAEHLANATHDARTTAMRLTDFARWQAREMATATTAGRDLAATLGQLAATAGAAAATGRRLAAITQTRDRVDLAALGAQVHIVVSQLHTLGDSARQLGDRALLVNDCSDHTRILALNAALQVSNFSGTGAYAGSGGFAVIAGELQRLGERSAAVAHDLNALVHRVQADVAAALTALAHAAQRLTAASPADDGEPLAGELAGRLHSVALVAGHQATAAGQMTTALGRLREVAIETLTDATHAIAVAGDLTDCAVDLGDVIGEFQLPAEAVPALAWPWSSALASLPPRARPGDGGPVPALAPAPFPFAGVLAESSAAMAAMDAQAHGRGGGATVWARADDGEEPGTGPQPPATDLMS